MTKLFSEDILKGKNDQVYLKYIYTYKINRQPNVCLCVCVRVCYTSSALTVRWLDLNGAVHLKQST